MRGPADVDAATQAYLDQLTPEAKARSDAYFEGGYWLLLLDAAYGVAIALLLLGTGLSARMRDFAERVTRVRFLRSLLYAAEYFVAAAILSFPLSLYEGFIREHKYGLSNHTFAGWLGDEAKGLLVTLVLGSLAVAGIYRAIGRWPRTWSLWASIMAVAFICFFGAVAPVFISPLFNTYKPLPDSPLKAKIVSLARANGIPAQEVWQFDASKQTKRMSANVSGMFNTTRISLNDNLLNRGSPEEIQAVLGHEMGHYVLNHVYKFILEFGVLIVVFFAILRWAMEGMLRRYGTAWRVRDIADLAGLPLFVAIFSLLFFLATPITNSLVRAQEAEADMFGLNAARQPDGFARAALHLSEYRKMKPGPLEEFVFFDHPSGWNRIRRSMVWKAEHLHDPDLAEQRGSF
ncbi:MAG TPA: M48 family metallopeptidase [Myxococcales bacterium]